MGLPSVKFGGTIGYNTNAVFPVVSANAGTSFQTVSACATTLATAYPAPIAGNVCVVTNSASVTALCVYDGTIWCKN